MKNLMGNIIHYGNWYFTELLCGKDTVRNFPSVWNNDFKKVTCKSCIKLYNDLQLSDNTDYAEIGKPTSHES